MDYRTPRRSSRARLMRVSVTEVELRGGSLPRRLEMEKERRRRPISARAAIVASAAVGREVDLHESVFTRDKCVTSEYAIIRP